MASDLETRIRHVTAVLGPTNTGKTHLAIERMLGHESGMIGLPLRLLAREVYDKISARVGADKVALITGEEKIKPERARYWVATVEAMPRDVDVEFLAIDEIQLSADPERGHVFTDRLLHARGKSETLLLGAQTMRDAIEDLIPGANFISRPRLSKLTYAGQKKITRMPARSAIVAFSAAEVYSIAELVRRQRGGAAVVMGALSPRTRNAQVALYQSGDVDFLVATDAIGMGINLDVDHVAFAATRKFDGQNHRSLTPSELAQIAGRAGRHMNDGTFGVTGAADPFDADIIERLESHSFDPVRVLQWRNRSLDFRSLDALRESLREMPREQRLTRARMADDVLALEMVSADREVAELASAPAAVAKLWDVCQVPDYRKISGQNHAELVGQLYKYLMSPEERIPEDWFAKQVQFADRTDGDIDTLANRIAHIRTWTFVSNRADWLQDPAHWQGRARAIEDALSDALHERLTQRFVDLRTSALVKGMRDKDELNAEIADDGAVQVENHFVGRLKGFRFQPDPAALSDQSINGKAARAATAQVLEREYGMRARRVASAKADALKLTRRGLVLWRDEEIAKVEAGADPLKPIVTLLADENLTAPDRDKVQAKLETWLGELIGDRLKPLADIAKAEDIHGLARGIAFRLVENLGVLKREAVAEEIKSLDQSARSELRKYGLRFGAFNIFFPLLLKPASADLALTLWLLKHASAHGLSAETPPEPPRAGLTSVATDAAIPEAFYRAYGFHLCGPRAVRLDILERLADQIRPLLAWRPNPDAPDAPAPKGSTGDGGFTVTSEMMSILGCSPDELGNVLKSLGFRLERRPVKPKPVALATTAADAVETAAADAPSAVADAATAANGPETGEADATPAAAGSVASSEAVAPVGAMPSLVEPAAAVIEPSVIEPPTPQTAAEPVAVEPAASAADAASAVAEPEMEDVWRPRRHKSERHERQRHHGQQRGRDNDRRRGQRGGASADASGTAVSVATPDTAPAPAEGATTTAAPAAEGAGPRQEHRHGQRQNRERDREQRREPRKEGRPGGEGNRDRDRNRAGERGERGERRDRDRDRGRDQRGGGRRSLETHTAAPPRRTGADADSPFAKLMALRESLEKQSREPGS